MSLGAKRQLFNALIDLLTCVMVNRFQREAGRGGLVIIQLDFQGSISAASPLAVNTSEANPDGRQEATCLSLLKRSSRMGSWELYVCSSRELGMRDLTDHDAALWSDWHWSSIAAKPPEWWQET